MCDSLFGIMGYMDRKRHKGKAVKGETITIGGKTYVKKSADDINWL